MSVDDVQKGVLAVFGFREFPREVVATELEKEGYKIKRIGG